METKNILPLVVPPLNGCDVMPNLSPPPPSLPLSLSLSRSLSPDKCAPGLRD